MASKVFDNVEMFQKYILEHYDGDNIYFKQLIKDEWEANKLYHIIENSLRWIVKSGFEDENLPVNSSSILRNELCYTLTNNYTLHVVELSEIYEVTKFILELVDLLSENIEVKHAVVLELL